METGEILLKSPKKIMIFNTTKYYIDRMREMKKSDQSQFLAQFLNTVSEEHNRPLNESEAAEELMGLMFVHPQMLDL